MKRYILLALLASTFFWISPAFSATLTCDPIPGVDRYEFRGLADIQWVDALPGGVLRVSLDAIPAGAYVIKARAWQGVWVSDWSAEYPFEKPALTLPGGWRFEK